MNGDAALRSDDCKNGKQLRKPGVAIIIFIREDCCSNGDKLRNF